MRSHYLLTTIGLSALALAGAQAARAQEAAPQNRQSPALPQTIPGLENYSLPTNDRLRLPDARQTPRPVPTPTPTPAPSPAPRATPIIRPTASPPLMVQPLPTPTPTPTPSAAPPRRAPESRAAAVPGPASTSPAPPTAEPLAPPTAAPTPTTTPVAIPTPAAIPTGQGEGGSLLPLVLALLGIAAAGLAWLLLARRRAAAPAGEQDRAADAAPAVPARPTAPAERPQLDLAFRPRRAGLNLVSAAVDYELTIHNSGAAPARAVRVALQLFTAGERHDAEVRQFLDEPVDSPVVAPFDLAPGETKSVRAMALLPKAAVNVVTVKGRPMFVPMVAINALYEWGEGRDGQTASSHVVGIARPGAPKMQPFWLDAPPRMYDGVGEHAHAIALRR